MGLDPRQMVAAVLTVTMFVMLGSMIKNDHFDSLPVDSDASIHTTSKQSLGNGPWIHDRESLKPCWTKPVLQEADQSQGFVTFSLTNGPEYHVSQMVSTNFEHVVQTLENIKSNGCAPCAITMQYPQAAVAPERACAHNLVVRPSISFSPKIISGNRQRAFNFNSTKFRSAFPSSGLRSMSMSGRANHSAIRASSTSSSSSSSFSSSSSPWDEKPYQVLPNGKIVYLDEQDVVTFLDPPNELIPLDPSSYNPASYLWKKIGDIPEERRHRLLSLLNPRLISQAWEIAGTRYNNSKLVQKSASSLLAIGDSETVTEFWKCRTSGGPLQIAWLNFFKKVVFRTGDGRTYGRLISESVFSGLSNSFYPLYFTVSELKEVMSTEQPCDLAYEFKDGILDLPNFPRGFPKPAEHPWPFNDEIVIYVRHVAPGVMVGQAWQEGKALQQVPKKLCSEILMVKEYLSSQPQSS